MQWYNWAHRLWIHKDLELGGILKIISQMRSHKLNGLSCWNFQMLRLTAVQKTTMLKGLAAKTHHHASSMKQTIVSTSFSQDRLTLTKFTETNTHMYANMLIFFQFVYYLVNFFLYNEKCKCPADYNAHFRWVDFLF